jgi:hypothetical protein
MANAISHTESSAPQGIEQGRRIAFVVAGFSIALHGWAVISSLVSVGSSLIVVSTVRLVIVAAVGIALVEGRAWARWVLLLPILVDVWIESALFFRLLQVEQFALAGYVGSMAAIDLILACLLIWSRDLRAFLASRRVHGVPSV